MSILKVIRLSILCILILAARQPTFCMERYCQEPHENMVITLYESKSDGLDQLYKGYSPLKGLEKLSQLKEEADKMLADAQTQLLKDLNFKNIPLNEQQSMLSYLANEKVRSLSFRNCDVLNDTILRQLTLTHLKELDIQGCEGITWRGLLHLSQTALLLEDLNLTDHKNLDKIGNIGTYLYSTPLVFKNLKRLNINGCTNLAVVNIQAPQLEWFSCQKAPLSYETLLALFDKSPKLKFLDVKECPNISINPKLPFDKKEFLDNLQYDKSFNSREWAVIPPISSLFSWFFTKNQGASWDKRERSTPQEVLKIMAGEFYEGNSTQIKTAFGGWVVNDSYSIKGSCNFSLCHPYYKLQFWGLAEQVAFMRVIKKGVEVANAMLLYFNASKPDGSSLKAIKDYHSYIEKSIDTPMEYILLGIGSGSIGDIRKIEEFKGEANIRHLICFPSVEKPYQYEHIRDMLYAAAEGDEFMIDELQEKYDEMKIEDKSDCKIG